MIKKFILPTLLLALACTQANAQTKRIAHRSHSGADKNFSLAGADNFGNPPEDWKMRTVPVKDTAKAGTAGAKIEPKKKKRSSEKLKKGPKRKEKLSGQ